MSQDFTRKMVGVLRDDLGSWQLTNTIGHIAAFLGNKMKEPFDTGEFFLSKDGLTFPRNSQFPFIALKGKKEDLLRLVETLQKSDLIWLAYLQDMVDMIDDEELGPVVSQKDAKDMDILGVGIFGTKDELKDLTDIFKLWK